MVRATLRRAPEPLMGALLWWLVAVLILRARSEFSILWLGLGCLVAQAFPIFAIVMRTQKSLRV